MCGRFAIATSTPELARILDARPTTDRVGPRYNVAPTDEAPVCRLDEAGARVLAALRWGLVPHWARDPRTGARMINARAESVAERPAYRDAFRRRRCVVPADGYYEWQPRAAGGKQPWFIHGAHGGPLLLAGLWERWTGDGSGTPLETFTILTTAAAPAVAALHARMPVALAPADLERWLEPRPLDPGTFAAVLDAGSARALAAHPVSTHVNRPGNDGPRCIEPLAEGDAVAGEG